MEKVYQETTCIICTEELKQTDIMTFPCGHKCCHVTCFVKNACMSSSGLKCPVCRFDVSPRSEASGESKEVENPRIEIIPIGGTFHVFPYPDSERKQQDLNIHDEQHISELTSATGALMSILRELPPYVLIPSRRNPSVQCSAFTVYGRRCKRRTRNLDGLCTYHNE